jgi:hypothetical protein
MRPRYGIAAVVLALMGVLAYLRDPPWIAAQTTGMWDREQAADGSSYRWANSHATFFVPADALAARLRVSTTFDQADAEPMTVTVSVDGERAARVLLTDAAWHDLTITLPPKGSRQERRIDVRTNRVRADNRAVRIADVELVAHQGR